MFTFDDVAALSALRDSFAPSSADYQIADNLVQHPDQTGPVQQGQLADVMQSSPNPTAVTMANVVLAYWQSLN